VYFGGEAKREAERSMRCSQKLKEVNLIIDSRCRRQALIPNV
jgi:hypothetical protein